MLRRTEGSVATKALTLGFALPEPDWIRREESRDVPDGHEQARLVWGARGDDGDVDYSP